MLPNECIYSILLFLNPKHLQLGSQINNNFNNLCRLDSLWKNRIADKYNELFRKENYYKNCKTYYQLVNLKSKLELSFDIDNLYMYSEIGLTNRKLTQLPREIGLLTNLQKLQLDMNELTELPKRDRQLN